MLPLKHAFTSCDFDSISFGNAGRSVQLPEVLGYKFTKDAFLVHLNLCDQVQKVLDFFLPYNNYQPSGFANSPLLNFKDEVPFTIKYKDERGYCGFISGVCSLKDYSILNNTDDFLTECKLEFEHKIKNIVGF